MSAGQLPHVAGGPHDLIRDVKTDKLKIYIDVINRTGTNLAARAVAWTVNDGGTMYQGSNALRLDDGKTYPIETPDLRGFSAQMTIKVNGSAIRPFTYSVQRVIPGRPPKFEKVVLT